MFGTSTPGQPAGLMRVDVLVDGQVVADADWRACDEGGVDAS
jgi:hypothetical protein